MLSVPSSTELLTICAVTLPSDVKHREVVRSLQEHASGRHPMLDERGLHLRDDRADDPEVAVPPVVGILGIAVPLVRDAHAARESDSSVDDQEFAVRPVVDAIEAVPMEWLILLHLDATRAHGVQLRRVHLCGPDRVDDEMHFDAMTGPLDERVREALTHGPRPVDVRFECHALRRVVDVLEHRPEDLTAVVQRRHLVPRDQRRSEEHAIARANCGSSTPYGECDRVGELVLSRGHVHPDDRHEGRDNGGDCGDGGQDQAPRSGLGFQHRTFVCRCAGATHSATSIATYMRSPSSTRRLEQLSHQLVVGSQSDGTQFRSVIAARGGPANSTMRPSRVERGPIAAFCSRSARRDSTGCGFIVSRFGAGSSGHWSRGRVHCACRAIRAGPSRTLGPAPASRDSRRAAALLRFAPRGIPPAFGRVPDVDGRCPTG